jgi:hypothetical protein
MLPVRLLNIIVLQVHVDIKHIHCKGKIFKNVDSDGCNINEQYLFNVIVLRIGSNFKFKHTTEVLLSISQSISTSLSKFSGVCYLLTLIDTT